MGGELGLSHLAGARPARLGPSLRVRFARPRLSSRPYQAFGQLSCAWSYHPSMGSRSVPSLPAPPHNSSMSGTMVRE